MVSYFRHKYHVEGLRNIFQPEALTRASQSIWDADKQEVISPADLYLDQSGDILDDFDILDTMAPQNYSNNNNSSTVEIDRVERLFTGDDSTSVGTLFTNNQNINPTEKQDNITSHETSATKSGFTSNLTSDADSNMARISNELVTVKIMMQQILNNQTTANTTTKEAAGNSEGVICSKP
jgi:hypothetical protein